MRPDYWLPESSEPVGRQAVPRPQFSARWLPQGGMALQVELIPTGEIIRVVHPHRPCKLVSWDAWAGGEGGSVSPRSSRLPQANPSKKGEQTVGGTLEWGQD